jgi:hypothetical protein
LESKDQVATLHTALASRDGVATLHTFNVKHMMHGDIAYTYQVALMVLPIKTDDSMIAGLL